MGNPSAGGASEEEGIALVIKVSQGRHNGQPVEETEVARDDEDHLRRQGGGGDDDDESEEEDEEMDEGEEEERSRNGG